MKLRPNLLPIAALAFLLSFCPSLAGAHTAPAALRPITVEDYFQVREVDDPPISPDGQWVAYTVATASLTDDD